MPHLVARFPGELDAQGMTSPVLLGNSIVYLTYTPLSYAAEARPDNLPKPEIASMIGIG
jgi:hypothetical protein